MESVWINGKYNLLEDYIKDSRRLNNLTGFEKEILSFILEWKAGKDTFHLKSSGSTGTPKKITLHRDQMILSAESTLDFLGITSGSKALLCLDPRYIAGRMVIVRSIIGKMELHAMDPGPNPLSKYKPDYRIDLASFVPYQVVGILNDPNAMQNFRNIKNVLIGGAGISPQMEKQLESFENRIFHTFGMTETVSHIALKQLSGSEHSNYFKVIPGISIGRDKRGCLTVAGKITKGKTLITNDLVEIKGDKEFVWNGRIDQVINTGGIKVNINLLEVKIREILESMNILSEFFIDHIADEKLGDKIILIFESGSGDIDLESVRETLRKKLSKFEIPREIRVVKKFTRTDTGKINRKLIVEQIQGF